MMSATAIQTRRNFLHYASVAGASLALAPMLVGCDSDDYEAAANAARQPMPQPAADLRELVRLATLAPSGHNTQPWKFRVGAGSIRIYPDLTRRVSVVDPDNRELWISLGSALENLLVAAAHFGYQSEVTYHLAGTSADHIAVALQKTGPAPLDPSQQFTAISLRQSTRSTYDGKPVSTGELRQLETTATTLNLKCAYLNQPCEVPAVRAQVQSHLSLNGAFPQLLMRFGHGPAMPRSLRRPVSEVLLTTKEWH